MKKLNNKAFTLIEIITALAIMTSFMVVVIYFIFTASRSTTKTQSQVELEQDAQEAYGRIYDFVTQSTCMDITVNGPASGNAVAIPSANASGDETYSPSFYSRLSSNQPVHFISKAAFKHIGYVNDRFMGNLTAYKNTATGGYSVDGVGHPLSYYKTETGQLDTTSHQASRPEYEEACLYLQGKIPDYGVYDKGTYNLSNMYLGPVTLKAGDMTYATVLYDKAKQEVYLSKSKSEPTFDKNDDTVIARHCTDFLIKAYGSRKNSIEVKLTFSNSGYTYNVGGIIDLRNSNVMK